MSRKQRTIATFAVTIQVPEGSNLSNVQLYLRDAIVSHGGGLNPDEPMFDIKPDWFTVTLTRKVTTYGQN